MVIGRRLLPPTRWSMRARGDPMRYLILLLAPAPLASAAEPLTTAGNGMPAPSPIDRTTIAVRDGDTTVRISTNTVLIPAGKFTFGEGRGAREEMFDAYCMGRFEVTNAEYKQ